MDVSVLIGDEHSEDFWKRNYEAFLLFKPDFLLLEVIGKHSYLNKRERNLAKLTNVFMEDSSQPGYNSDAFKLADVLDVPMIGIDTWEDPYVFPSEWDELDHKTNFEYSHKIREANMVGVLSRYENKGKCLLIVGSEHLRRESVLFKYASRKKHDIKLFHMSK